MAPSYDETPLHLKCGTKLYRQVYCNKQAMCKFTRTFPGEKLDRTEPTIDVRVAVGDLSFGFPTQMHFHAIQRLTYEQVRSACLDYQLTKTA
tara:strand:+ start:293 stop:568 length:276 start_codon:yes stop_codon:yes gene_type:complete